MTNKSDKASATHSTFAFFGTPYVARDTLARLIECGFTPSVVVTNPDAPRGRKHVMTPTETRVLAEAHGIPVLAPTKLDNDAVEAIAAYSCDYAVVVAYGKILPEALIHAFPKGVLNVHYSLLPKYRGATPVEAALLAGDETTGVTIQQMVKALDAGDIIAQEETAIIPTETTVELRPRLVSIGAELLCETLPLYLRGDCTPTPQNHQHATHVGKLTKADGEISLSDSDQTNWRKYRAYAEWPGVFFIYNEQRIKITKAELADGEFRILRVIPAGKQEMDFSAWEQATT